MPDSDFLYFLDAFSSSESGNFGFYYSFANSGTNSGVCNSSITAPTFSLMPKINGSGVSFWSKTGSGFFNGSTTIKLSGSGDFIGEGFPLSFFAISQKSGLDAGVVFSNLSSGTAANGVSCSGFSFGFNAANRLFFEYYDNFAQKPVMFTNNKVLADKNCYAFRITSNGVMIDVYDFFKDSSDSNFYQFVGGPPEVSNDWTIGSCNSGASWSEKHNFKGWIDEIGYSRSYLSDGAFSAFASGAVYNATFSGGISGSGYQVGVTGYSTGLIPVFSGITGYLTVETGVVTDIFGNQYSGVEVTPLSGVTYLTGTVPLTGLIPYPLFADGSWSTQINQSAADSFSYSAANLLKEVSDGDFYSLYSPSSGSFSTRVLKLSSISKSNQSSTFDRIQAKFNYGVPRSISGITFSVNGKFQTTGFLTGDKFHSFDVDGGDFFYSGGKIYSTGFYSIDDSIIIDNLSDNSQQIRFPNFSHVSGTGNHTFANFTNFIAFFNGQKLHSGSDYFLNASGAFFSGGAALFSGEFGELQILSGIYGVREKIQVNNPFIPSSGVFSEQSLYFLNGVRQIVNEDYILTSNSDFLTGLSSNSGHLSVIFNNDFSFFE